MKTKRISLFVALLLCFSFLTGQVPPALAQTKNVSFASLSKGQKINGFRAEAVYLNDADQPFGARFIHERTGFTLDLLQIQSVPQSYLWVKTFTISDMGEPPALNDIGCFAP